MTDDQLMSVRDLADYLQVDMSTVYLWSQRGQIPDRGQPGIRDGHMII